MIKSLGRLLAEVFRQWQEDRGQQVGAALAFYTIFSLPAVLLIAFTIGGAVLGPQADEEQLTPQLESFFGRDQAQVLLDLTRQARRSPAGSWATAVGVVVLFVTATGAALGLKEALDTVWGVVENPDLGWWSMIGDRLVSLVLVFAFGGLLLVSMTLTATLVRMGDYLSQWLPFSLPVAQAANIVVSGLMVALLLALAFRLLPDVRIRWREVWLGAVATAVLFMAGKELIGLYLGRMAASSAYGAAGSLLLVMLWIYYSAQILLLGAEFTQVYAARTGAPIEPARGALSVGNRRDRDAYLRRLKAERAERSGQQRVARRGRRAVEAALRSAAASPWKGLLWALGGLALGWLIGVWNR